MPHRRLVVCGHLKRSNRLIRGNKSSDHFVAARRRRAMGVGWNRTTDRTERGGFSAGHFQNKQTVPWIRHLAKRLLLELIRD